MNPARTKEPGEDTADFMIREIIDMIDASIKSHRKQLSRVYHFGDGDLEVKMKFDMVNTPKNEDLSAAEEKIKQHFMSSLKTLMRMIVEDKTPGIVDAKFQTIMNYAAQFPIQIITNYIDEKAYTKEETYEMMKSCARVDYENKISTIRSILGMIDGQEPAKKFEC